VVLATAEAGWQWGGIVGRPFEETLRLYDRAIALDSGFTPSYPHAAFIALAMGDPVRAVGYVDAHLRWGPSASVRGALRLMESLLTPGPEAHDRAERLLDSLPVYALSKAWGLLLMSADSGEAVVRILRKLRMRNPEGMWTYSLGMALGARGHLREMRELARGDPDLPYWITPFAAILIPEDSLALYRSRWLHTTDPFAGMPKPYLKWLADRGDTAVLAHLLVTARERDDSAVARAFLALARHDTADAVARFLAFPDSTIPLWWSVRLTKAQLLRESGHLREAARTLRPTFSPWGSDYYPHDGPWHLERGRTLEQIGDTAGARQAYRTVLDLWRHADPELQPFVTEARGGTGPATRAITVARLRYRPEPASTSPHGIRPA
jgi:eukaryotic-like serine/threonine-protein kinase